MLSRRAAAEKPLHSTTRVKTVRLVSRSMEGSERAARRGSPLSKRAGASARARHRQVAPGLSGLAGQSFCFLSDYHSARDAASSECKVERVERLQKKEDAMAQISSPATVGSTGTQPGLLPSRAVLKRTIAGLALLFGIAIATAYGYQYWTVGRFLESTDDAYIKADYTTIAPKVSGYIADVLVEDNEPVNAGRELARIDDPDFRAALAQAQADARAAQATIANLHAQITLQQSLVDQ